MTQTEMQLVAVYGPAVPLAEVSQAYFGMCYRVAREAAAMNELPVPTFRLTDSQRAPVLMHAADLAIWIDKTRDAAAKEWGKSQL